MKLKNASYLFLVLSSSLLGSSVRILLIQNPLIVILVSLCWCVNPHACGRKYLYYSSKMCHSAWKTLNGQYHAWDNNIYFFSVLYTNFHWHSTRQKYFTRNLRYDEAREAVVSLRNEETRSHPIYASTKRFRNLANFPGHNVVMRSPMCYR